MHLVCAFEVEEAAAGEHFFFTIDRNSECHISEEKGENYCEAVQQVVTPEIIEKCSPQAEGTTVYSSVNTKLSSDRSDTSIYATFDNYSSRVLYYYWQDFSGSEIYYQESAGYDERDQQTYVTHPWKAWYKVDGEWVLLCGFEVDEATANEHFYFTIDEEEKCFITTQKGENLCI